MFNLKRKVLFGVSVSMVLAMAIGSFALSETQTPARPRMVKTQSAVSASSSVEVGAFTITGEDVTLDSDYTFTGTSGTDGVLTIISSKEMTIQNTTPSTETSDRIEINLPNGVTEANLKLNGVNINTSTGPALKIQDNATFNVNILLPDGSENYLKSNKYANATLQKSCSSSSEIENLGMLTIDVPEGSVGTGKLEVTASESSESAAIGGGGGTYGANIKIINGNVTATGGRLSAGIGGGNRGGGRKIYITGGVVKAYGGRNGAGIGSGDKQSGGSDAADINISGGTVYAKGGRSAPGIGGGFYGNADRINISGGTVEAIGTGGAAGIGGGSSGYGNNIEITGGVIKAIGGTNQYNSYGSGIGGGHNKTGSNNSINGDAVVFAASSNTAKPALDGFNDGQGGSLLNKGIVFTGVGIFNDTYELTGVDWQNGALYGDSVTITGDVTIPIDFTIASNATVIVDKKVNLTLEEGKNLTIQGTLKNDGTVPEDDTLVCDQTGTIETKTDFYLEDGSLYEYDSNYQTYKTSAGLQKYVSLPNPDDSNALTLFDGWYTQPNGEGVKVDESINVLLNHHNFYERRAAVAEYTITATNPENGRINLDINKATEGTEIMFTVTADDGYRLSGLPVVQTEDGTGVTVTEKDGKYTFTMPGSDVLVSAFFELISEPTFDPDVKTGDSFTGIAALAILGLATTGAVLVRKRK